MSRIAAGSDDLEGAAAKVNEVFTIATQRRSANITKRLQQLVRLLERPRYQISGLALGLRDEIRAFASVSTAPALPEGQ